MTKQQRNEQQPFSLQELELIEACLFEQEPLELVGTETERFTYAMRTQMPRLYSAWKAKERADAEMFVEQNNLLATIRIKKEQENVSW